MDKGLLIEYLGADVAVNTLELDPRQGGRQPHRLHCIPVFQCKTEFGVDLSGADKAVGMRVDTRCDSQVYRGGLPPLPRHG